MNSPASSADNELAQDLAALDRLLSSDSRWTKNALGRIRGVPTREVDSADCWCLSGAAMVVTHDITPRWGQLLNALERAAYGRSGISIVSWNDAPERSFAEVKALIAKARSSVLSSAVSEPDQCECGKPCKPGSDWCGTCRG